MGQHKDLSEFGLLGQTICRSAAVGIYSSPQRPHLKAAANMLEPDTTAHLQGPSMLCMSTFPDGV